MGFSLAEFIAGEKLTAAEYRLAGRASRLVVSLVVRLVDFPEVTKAGQMWTRVSEKGQPHA
jgi:hypothetical protein